MLERPDREVILGVLRDAVSAIPLISAVALILSYVYEARFFKILGFKSDILTISDYLTLSFQWLPYISSMYILGLIAGAMAFRNSSPEQLPSVKDMSYDELVELRDRIVRKLKRSKIVIYSITFTLTILVFIFAYGLLRAIAGIGIGFAIIIYLGTTYPYLREKNIYAIICFSVMLISYAILQPSIEVDNLLRKKNYVTVNFGDSTESKNAVIFRNMERGILLRLVDTQELYFVPTDEFRFIRRYKAPSPGSSFFEQWTGIRFRFRTEVQ